MEKIMEMTEADWVQFDALTEADIDLATVNDLDWQGVDLQSHKGWHVVRPDGSSNVPLLLNANTTHLLQLHQLDYQTFLSGVLKAYVDSQQKLQD